MVTQTTTDTNDFNYVWRCKSTRVEDKQTIPIKAGDYLFICVCPDGKAHFRYRAADWREGKELCGAESENAALWAKARAEVNGKGNGLVGTLDGTRKFEMTIEKTGAGSRISCRHFFNPDEGSWDGEDDWGGQAQ